MEASGGSDEAVGRVWGGCRSKDLHSKGVAPNLARRCWLGLVEEKVRGGMGVLHRDVNAAMQDEVS